MHLNNDSVALMRFTPPAAPHKCADRYRAANMITNAVLREVIDIDDKERRAS